MNTKDKIIKNILLQLKYIVDAHSNLEEKPISIGDNIVLTPREIHIIQAIGENREMNIKELGEYFRTSKSAASQMISKLVVKGFIRKVNPVDNNKELKLFLTESGKNAFAVHEKFHSLYTSNLSQKLDSVFQEKELTKTLELLELVKKVMEKKILSL